MPTKIIRKRHREAIVNHYWTMHTHMLWHSTESIDQLHEPILFHSRWYRLYAKMPTNANLELWFLLCSFDLYLFYSGDYMYHIGMCAYANIIGHIDMNMGFLADFGDVIHSILDQILQGNKVELDEKYTDYLLYTIQYSIV